MRTFEDAISDILDCNIIHNIGQFAKRDLRLLDKAAKQGLISKGKGGEFPNLMTVFAPKGFDFTRHRVAVIEKIKKLSSGELPQKEWLTKFDYKIFID